ncbi:isoleucine--tRNA ligase [Mycoplasmopsis verecunda]|uniref:Isoleucine--tRNA ligase n=1 Tax=Mycoplasmopsis verecunda TaxID=171291 RepID=A0A1T4MCC1_9BACT|nr:isoleucine--tRNA ligase [Mycoplasmopsis verecunda]WPB54514.1 isoleucine--tRNA ligase [Mycoplasmopsis verecunda]SJZ64517.1 Isoleucyl-tRNA synthetase [Mycoplasmopsis verecunda]
MDYKKTLNMPNTSFEMRANLTSKEPIYRENLLKNQVYKRVLELHKNDPKFILHDGPPYANGDIHVGHAMNKILKDFIVRYKTLSGFYSPYVPGWDTHGLPIEHKMLQEMNVSKEDLDPVTLRKKAHTYALSQVERQKSQFMQLQIFADFEKIYITLAPEYEAKQLEVFAKMMLDGLVYKGLKPIYWSPSSQSALAEAEVEYQDVKSPSIYVKMHVEKSNYDLIQPGDCFLVWTTTPWTLIANAAVALGNDIEYLVFNHDGTRYIMASDLYNDFIAKLNWESEVISTFKGSEINGKEIFYYTPILHQLAPAVIGHHVTNESGTGIVHIAPMFGEDDFLIGQKNNLEKIMHISDKGYIENTNTQFDGKFYMDANKDISIFLGDDVVHFQWVKHSYPHDWRTHQPIIFRGTPQWFVSIDKIRQQILDQIDSAVNTYPEWAKNRLFQMIENRHDWTISRQRTWGLPLIIFYDQDGEAIIDQEQFDHIINLVRQHGSDIWWEWDTEQLLLPKYQNKNFTREMDIMDVWFDSGVSSIAVDIDGNVQSPYDLYLEGIDQYRGWFNSSIITSVAYKGISPYKNLISHGFALDGKGEKMSKSKGNVIAPIDVITKRGADILRLWVANSEYTNDVSISNEILDQNTEIYRKIRNTIKFILGNLDQYNYDANTTRTGIHLFIKEQLNYIKSEVFKAYDEYKFINVIKLINNYLVELSSFYLSVTKDILYIRERNDAERLMVLANLYEILDFLLLALAPILPTTIEEAYSHFNKINKYDSIMFESYNKNDTYSQAVLEQFKEFFDLRDKVNVLIDEATKNGIIKRSNEVQLILPKQSDFINCLDLKTLLMVGNIVQGDEIKVEKFKSVKCNRCWNHFEENVMQGDLCPLCFSIISKME